MFLQTFASIFMRNLAYFNFYAMIHSVMVKTFWLFPLSCAAKRGAARFGRLCQIFRHGSPCPCPLYIMFARAKPFQPRFGASGPAVLHRQKIAKIWLCASTTLDINQENAFFLEKSLEIIARSRKSPYLCSVKTKEVLVKTPEKSARHDVVRQRF